jgi:hypothetical protein
MQKTYTTDEALKECFEQITLSNLGATDYNKLRQYKRRHEKGELKGNAIEYVLNYFGFSKNITWAKKDTDN